MYEHFDFCDSQYETEDGPLPCNCRESPTRQDEPTRTELIAAIESLVGKGSDRLCAESCCAKKRAALALLNRCKVPR